VEFERNRLILANVIIMVLKQHLPIVNKHMLGRIVTLIIMGIHQIIVEFMVEAAVKCQK
jgi:hypothetical protein